MRRAVVDVRVADRRDGPARPNGNRGGDDRDSTRDDGNLVVREIRSLLCHIVERVGDLALVHARHRRPVRGDDALALHEVVTALYKMWEGMWLAVVHEVEFRARGQRHWTLRNRHLRPVYEVLVVRIRHLVPHHVFTRVRIDRRFTTPSVNLFNSRSGASCRVTVVDPCFASTHHHRKSRDEPIRIDRVPRSVIHRHHVESGEPALRHLTVPRLHAAARANGCLRNLPHAVGHRRGVVVHCIICECGLRNVGTRRRLLVVRVDSRHALRQASQFHALRRAVVGKRSGVVPGDIRHVVCRLHDRDLARDNRDRVIREVRPLLRGVGKRIGYLALVHARHRRPVRGDDALALHEVVTAFYKMWARMWLAVVHEVEFRARGERHWPFRNRHLRPVYEVLVVRVRHPVPDYVLARVGKAGRDAIHCVRYGRRGLRPSRRVLHRALPNHRRTERRLKCVRVDGVSLAVVDKRRVEFRESALRHTAVARFVAFSFTTADTGLRHSQRAVLYGDVVVARRRLLIERIGEGVFACAHDGLRTRERIRRPFTIDEPVAADRHHVCRKRCPVVDLRGALRGQRHRARCDPDADRTDNGRIVRSRNPIPHLRVADTAEHCRGIRPGVGLTRAVLYRRCRQQPGHRHGDAMRHAVVDIRVADRRDGPARPNGNRCGDDRDSTRDDGNLVVREIRSLLSGVVERVGHLALVHARHRRPVRGDDTLALHEVLPAFYKMWARMWQTVIHEVEFRTRGERHGARSDLQERVRRERRVVRRCNTIPHARRDGVREDRALRRERHAQRVERVRDRRAVRRERRIQQRRNRD